MDKHLVFGNLNDSLDKKFDSNNDFLSIIKQSNCHNISYDYTKSATTVYYVYLYYHNVDH